MTKKEAAEALFDALTEMVAAHGPLTDGADQEEVARWLIRQVVAEEKAAAVLALVNE